MKELELLAPARNADIGIAAIDCGADAVYIAGPAFGARQAAGNPVEEVRRLCAYAHRFGARVFVTFNTILFEDELDEARRLFLALEEAGADAFIVQDLAVLDFGAHVPLHASTQCAIRTPEQARFYESLGFSRLVLERELSLEEVAAIRAAVSCELEFFVHGALCVCYSGNCYLSEYLAGRSANRGACVQACRSLYDLSDASGKVLLRDKALLSLRDYNLSERLEELAAGGICSFKIEGRLKNQSYVCNVVRAYSRVLDALVAAQPRQWRRASFGTVRGGFEPDLSKTFNRGYTQLYLEVFDAGLAILMKEEVYKQTFHQKEATTLYFCTSGDATSVEKDMKPFLKSLGATWSTKAEDTKENDEANQQIVMIMEVFAYLAMIIASIGVFNNITICFFQRKRELAVMASVGMNKSRRMGLVLSESLLSVALSIAISIPFTILLAAAMTAFCGFIGLPMNIVFSWSQLPLYAGVIAVIIFIATFSTMLKSRKLSVVQELKYE